MVCIIKTSLGVVKSHFQYILDELLQSNGEKQLWVGTHVGDSSSLQ